MTLGYGDERFSRRDTRPFFVRNGISTAPTISLNSQDHLLRGRLRVIAVIGTVLQLGVIIYAGFITYYAIPKFKKDDSSVRNHAFTCFISGALLMTSGILICSYIVESCTKKDCFASLYNDDIIKITRLDHKTTVSDPGFNSYALFPKDYPHSVTLSSRTTWNVYRDNAIGTAITFIRYVLQLIGLRGMHCSVSIVQLVVIVVMIGLRAWVRRRLTQPPLHKEDMAGFELDQLSQTLVDLEDTPWLESSNSNPELPDQWRVASPRPVEAYQPVGLERNSIIGAAESVLRVMRGLGELTGSNGIAHVEVVALARAINSKRVVGCGFDGRNQRGNPMYPTHHDASMLVDNTTTWDEHDARTQEGLRQFRETRESILWLSTTFKDSSGDIGVITRAAAALIEHWRMVEIMIDFGQDTHDVDTNLTTLNGLQEELKCELEKKNETIVISLFKLYQEQDCPRRSTFLAGMGFGKDNEAIWEDATPSRKLCLTELHRRTKSRKRLVPKQIIAWKDVEARNVSGWTQLHYTAACRSEDVARHSGNIETAHINVGKLILVQGLNEEPRSYQGLTPPHHAARSGRTDVAKTLVYAGVCLETRDGCGRTPLHWVALKGHGSLAESLILMGADKEAGDSKGQKVLHYAAQSGHAEVVEILLDKGAAVEAMDRWESTALHYAAGGGHADVVKILLDNGTHMEAKDTLKRTALRIAAGNGHKSVVEALLGKHAQKETGDSFDLTPLHGAARNNHLELVNVLLAAGASTEARDHLGRTPLDLAGQFGHWDVAQCLRSRAAR